ncbi:MAG: hypothetical protein KGQ37_05065 [Hyphomicrobiales bacterium]|nr:hypothetical protein [Hyphomicrobiales bacterium]
MIIADKTEHIPLLRAAIAKIEAAGAARGAEAGRVALGRHLALDRALGGGLPRHGLCEIVPASAGDNAAASAFGLALALLLGAPGAVLFWVYEDFAVSEAGLPYGPGLWQMGFDPARLVLVAAPRALAALNALEEVARAGAGVALGEICQRRGYDLAASRRLKLAAEEGGRGCVLVLAAASGTGPDFASAAATRLEVASAMSAPLAPVHGRLAIPGPARFSVRVLKARGEGACAPPEASHIVAFDPSLGCLVDAFPVAPPAHSQNRPRGAADAGGRYAKSA